MSIGFLPKGVAGFYPSGYKGWNWLEFFWRLEVTSNDGKTTVWTLNYNHIWRNEN